MSSQATHHSPLGPEWPTDEDGFPHRQAARVVLFDEDGRVLLAQGHDRDEAERRWWFTIGGGIMDGESPRQAAVRELFEETGIRLDSDELEGPVLYRKAVFHFLTVTAKQDEWFFIARTNTRSLSSEGWTELERDVIDEQKWWDIDSLSEQGEEVEIFPRNLPTLAHRWRSGWDGILMHLEEDSRSERR